LLHSQSILARRKSAWIIYKIGSRITDRQIRDGAVSALIEALKDDDGTLRGNAPWGLGVLGGSKAIAALQAAAQDSSSTVRDAVEHALHQLGAPIVAPAPSKSAKSAAPAKPAKSAAPAKPAKSAAPAKSAKSAAPAKSAKSAAPAKPAKSAAPAKPAKSAAPASQSAPAPAPIVAAPVWMPTHLVPPGGMAAWDAPDPSRPPRVLLAERLELVVESSAGAWAEVRAVNGWRGWVDGRLLVGLR
jgi:hypothetical protein